MADEPNDPLVTLGTFCIQSLQDPADSDYAAAWAWTDAFLKRIDADHPGFYEGILQAPEASGTELAVSGPAGDDLVPNRVYMGRSKACNAAQMVVPLSWITEDNVDDFGNHKQSPSQ